MKVKVNKSLLNKNPNGSIFGGTIMAAADPFYPVLFNQVLNPTGDHKLRIWSKSAKVDFLKPATTHLNFCISLTDDDITHTWAVLKTAGKYEKIYPIEMYNNQGEVCATVSIEVYVRDLNFQQVL